MLATLGQRILLVVLVFVLGISLGALYKPVRLFLNQQLENTRAFIAGHPLEQETSIWQKIQNDLGLAPWRSTRKSLFSDNFNYQSVTLAPELKGFLPESVLDLYLDTKAAAITGYAGMLIKTPVDTGQGYSPRLLLVGFDGHLHKIITLEEDSSCDCSSNKPLNYFHIAGNPAEFGVLGNSLVKLNSCGHSDWSVDSKYSFHHYLNNDGDHQQDSFWILDATDLVQIETMTGTILDRISLSDIINTNSNLAVFEPRLKGTRQERWLYGDTDFVPVNRNHTEVEHADLDPFHTNDIDEYHGGETGLFEQGDLVLSFRSLNLLLVVRPATRKIVWYAYGLTSRQHDPDFVSSNSIIVYDNNFHNHSSRIVLLEASADTVVNPQFGARRIELVKNIEGN
ncbi:MAG: hypothetical protein GY770_02395, partial [Aestuariibacter sp.]|nr:hypothetical protein [Aestuariibacter sp.]